MSAYTVLDVEWHDESKAAEYRQLLGPSLQKYGGKTLVANQPQLLEGDWNPRRVVIIEFPDMETLRRWYDSKEHAPALRLRTEGATSRLIAVEPPPRP